MLNFAIQTARAAGRLLAERFGRALSISNKGELDLVTEADHATLVRVQEHDSPSWVSLEFALEPMTKRDPLDLEPFQLWFGFKFRKNAILI